VFGQSSKQDSNYSCYLARDISTARVKNRIMVRGIVNSRNRLMTNWKAITVGRISAKSYSNPMFSIRLELRLVLG
jgi:hypothetical protein